MIIFIRMVGAGMEAYDWSYDVSATCWVLFIEQGSGIAGADEEHDEQKELLLWTAIIGLLQILNTKAMSKNVIWSQLCTVQSLNQRQRIYLLIFSLRAAIKWRRKTKGKDNVFLIFSRVHLRPQMCWMDYCII